MACEPFDCDRCGEHHDRCAGHVDLYDDEGNAAGLRACHKWPKGAARVCFMHGGGAPQVQRAAERRSQVAKIRREVELLGIPVETDPVEALLNEIWETVGNVEFLRGLVQELPTHPGPDTIIGHNDDDEPIWKHGDPGIYGRTYHQSGLPTGEAKPHVLVQMYNEERKHLVDVSSAAIRLGIEERRVKLEENRAAEVFRAVSQALGAMGLEDRFPEFREHFAKAIATVRPVSIGTGTTS